MQDDQPLLDKMRDEQVPDRGSRVRLRSTVSLVSGAVYKAGGTFIVARVAETSDGPRLCLADDTGRVCIPFIAPALVLVAGPVVSGLRDRAGVQAEPLDADGIGWCW